MSSSSRPEQQRDWPSRRPNLTRRRYFARATAWPRVDSGRQNGFVEAIEISERPAIASLMHQTILLGDQPRISSALSFQLNWWRQKNPESGQALRREAVKSRDQRLFWATVRLLVCIFSPSNNARLSMTCAIPRILNHDCVHLQTDTLS